MPPNEAVSMGPAMIVYHPGLCRCVGQRDDRRIRSSGWFGGGTEPELRIDSGRLSGYDIVDGPVSRSVR